MAKFMSEEFIAEVQGSLVQDPQWTESTKTFKASVAFTVTDTGDCFVMTVDNGTTGIQKVPAGTAAEFSFEGTYDSWAKVAKGEVDIQSAVLKGQLKFKGSLTKILTYRDKFIRVAEIMKQVPKEF